MVKVRIRERKVSLVHYRSTVIWAVTSCFSWLFMQYMHICICMYIYIHKFNLLTHISYLYAYFKARPFGTGQPIGVLLLEAWLPLPLLVLLSCLQFFKVTTLPFQSLWRPVLLWSLSDVLSTIWLRGTKYNP